MTDQDSGSRLAARRLLREARQGSLATLMPQGGAPYCSLVAVASHPDGSPLLLISRLAVHTKNLLADRRVSLLLAAAGAVDPLQEARIMVAAAADVLGGDEQWLARRRYLAVHPSAEMFADFPDFLFVRLSIASIHLVAGFGRISDLTPADVLTDLSGAEAVVAAEESAVAHMNADHADALKMYAASRGASFEGNWRSTGLDPDGIDLVGDGKSLRVEFPSRVTDAGALRATLAAMARQEREKVGRR